MKGESDKQKQRCWFSAQMKLQMMVLYHPLYLYLPDINSVSLLSIKEAKVDDKPPHNNPVRLVRLYTLPAEPR